MSGLEAELAALRLQSTEQEKVVETYQRDHQAAQTESQNLEFTIRELNFEIESARRNKEMTGSILQQSQARKIALETEL
ncbi:MAG: hypothetical protein ACXVA9_10785, partial [Bdellovibrionales bacterium]